MTRREALKELNNNECLYHPELGYSVMMYAKDDICCFKVMSVIKEGMALKVGTFIPFEDFVESVIGFDEGWIRFS